MSKPKSAKLSKHQYESWSANQWERYLESLELQVEHSSLTRGPFERVLERATLSVFDLVGTNEVATVEMKRALLAAINDLPAQRRNLIKKIYFDGLTEQQVADLFGISQVAVHFRKIRAILQIKNSPQVRLIKKPKVGRPAPKELRDPFERIDASFQRGQISKAEKYRLWALYEVGALRKFVK